jgi:hypothetical protein
MTGLTVSSIRYGKRQTPGSLKCRGLGGADRVDRNMEDLDIAKQAFAELMSAAGDRKKAGWLEWKHVEGQLE